MVAEDMRYTKLFIELPTATGNVTRTIWDGKKFKKGEKYNTVIAYDGKTLPETAIFILATGYAEGKLDAETGGEIKLEGTTGDGKSITLTGKFAGKTKGGNLPIFNEPIRSDVARYCMLTQLDSKTFKYEFVETDGSKRIVCILTAEFIKKEE